MQDFYTVEQVAEKLQLTERSVREAITSNELKAYKKGKRYYIFHADIIEFLKNGNEKVS